MAEKEASLIIKIKETGSAALDKISSGLKEIGKVGLAAFTAIAGVAALAIKNYKEQELAVNKLNQALVNQGIYTRQTSEAYQKFATDLQRVTTYGDEQIITAQATLQSFIGQNKVTKELTRATLDLAAAKGIDLNSAANLIGKSISTATNALQRQGVQMELSGNTTQRMAQVTEVLNQKFGGQAEAAARGMGSIDRMKNSVSDLFEALGKELIPVVKFFTDAIIRMTDEVGNSNSTLAAFGDVIKFISQGVIILEGIIETVATAIGGVLGTALAGISFMMKGEFTAAYDAIKSGASGLKTDLTNTWSSIGQNLSKLDQEYASVKKDQMAEEEMLVNQSLANQGLAKEAYRIQDLELEKAAMAEKRTATAEHNALENEMWAIKSEEDLMRMQTQARIMADMDLANKLAQLNSDIAHAKTREQVLAAHNAKRKFMEEQYERERRANMDMADKFDAMMTDKKMQRANTSLSDLARLQDSKSREMVAIGKAAATAQIITDTARAVMGIWSWTSSIPFAGPIIGAALSAAMIAYGAEQIGRVNSAHMAEGGIVRATAGGIPAIIGEGGKDEAVIPLEDGGQQFGMTINLVVYGGLLGDESQARELAIALDKEMLKLRRANQSLAFDSSIT